MTFHIWRGTLFWKSSSADWAFADPCRIWCAGSDRCCGRFYRVCLSGCENPGRELATDARPECLLLWKKAVQAIVFFVGQVITNNLDIILVKHFFSANSG